MRAFMLLLIFTVLFIAVPVRAVDKEAPNTTDAQENESLPERAERPKREAVRMSPSIRQSPPRPDESGKMRRVAPPRNKSPLQDVPALRDPPPVPSGESVANH